MQSKTLILVPVLLIVIIYIPAFAKGATVKITITNVDSGARIESTEEAAVKFFSIWEGAGVITGGIPQRPGRN